MALDATTKMRLRAYLDVLPKKTRRTIKMRATYWGDEKPELMRHATPRFMGMAGTFLFAGFGLFALMALGTQIPNWIKATLGIVFVVVLISAAFLSHGEIVPIYLSTMIANDKFSVCPDCHYDLQGGNHDRCPECGVNVVIPGR
ncbi:MAG: hypothetical protein AAF432_16325 [Planctomycetota bacterium]